MTESTVTGSVTREVSTIAAAVAVILGGGYWAADNQGDETIGYIAAALDSALDVQSAELQASEVTVEHFNSLFAQVIARQDSILELLGEP